MATTKVTTGGITDATIATADIADSAATTAKIADSAVTGPKIADGTIGAVKLGSNVVTTAKIADDAVTDAKLAAGSVGTAALADTAVTLAKLPHGTSSNDGKFLRANNGADPTFETVTTTNINGNVDHRIITATGTAQQVQGESGLTYDGDNLNVTAGAHDSGLHVTAANNNQETRFSLIGKASDGTSHTWLLNAKRSANRLDFVGGGVTRASILSTGEFGVGTTAQESLLQVGGGTNPMTAKPTFHVAPSSGDATMSLRGGSPSIYFDGTGGGNAKLLTDGTDLTISSGNLDSNGTFRHYLTQYGHFAAKGDAGSWVADPGSSSNLYHQFCNTGNGRWVMRVQQEHHNGMVMQLRVNSTSNQEALQVQKYTSTASTRFQVLHSGNCANANNSFGAISDIKLKENIVDAKSQWDDVKAVKVRNFNLKEEKDTKLLGVVAQEIETVSSSLIFETIDRDPDDSTKEIGTTKNVKYSVLYMKAFKALQEAMAKIEVLETKVAALEAG